MVLLNKKTHIKIIICEMYLYLCDLQLKLKTKIMITKTTICKKINIGETGNRLGFNFKETTIRVFGLVVYRSTLKHV